MGFLGLVPSEYSTGDTRRQGDITKTGNSHARRVLVEAAWNYRFPARISRILADPPGGSIQSRTRDRLAGAAAPGAPLTDRLSSRKLHPNKICVAIARELAGFLWDIARHVRSGSLNSQCTLHLHLGGSHTPNHLRSIPKQRRSNAMRRPDEGNPRPGYVGINNRKDDPRP